MIYSTPLSTRSQISSKDGLVVAGNEHSAQAGAEMLERGGTAVDAIVAAGFVAFVAEPSMCGVGGGGHLTFFHQESSQFYAIDHNIRAPRRATPDMFALATTHDSNYMGFPATVGRRNEIGHLSVGVPGAVAGLCAAHERWGRLPLATVMQRSIELAENGIAVPWRLASEIAQCMGDFAAMPRIAETLAPGGIPLTNSDTWRDGDVLRIPGLAETLWRISGEGATGFYQGPVAESIADEMARNGGLITQADLESYQSKVSVEQGATYGPARYATCFDTVTGEMLNILEQMGLGTREVGDVDYYHLIAEAMACAFTDTLQHYGDPELERSPVVGLTSREFARLRCSSLRLDSISPRPMAPFDPWPFDPGDPVPPPPAGSVGGTHGTTHAVAGDRAGNLVSLCTSIETQFGSMVLVPETGVLLNNAMQDFDPRPGRPNSIGPGKMPLFGVPVLVAAKGSEGLLAASGAGGYRITASVLQPFINVVSFGGMAQAATDVPRVFCQGEDTYADASIPGEVLTELSARGHTLIVQADSPGSPAFGRVGLIVRNPRTGELQSGSNPSDVTAAVAV